MTGMNADSLIPLSKVPNYLPKHDGRKVSVASVYRWVSRGLSGVTLETHAGPYGSYTTEEALQKFWAEVGAARRTRCRPSAHAEASRAHERSMKELADLGL